MQPADGCRGIRGTMNMTGARASGHDPEPRPRAAHPRLEYQRTMRLSMKALYKPAPGAGLEYVDRPEPETGPRRREDPGAAHRHLRHRPAHREVGRLGRVDDRRAAHPGPRVLRRGRRGRRARARRRRRRPGVGRGAHRLRHVPQLPRRAPPDVHPHEGRGPAPRRRVRGVHRDARARTSGCTTPTSSPRSARSSTPSATPCTPRSRSRSSAKTCSSPAAARSA